MGNCCTRSDGIPKAPDSVGVLSDAELRTILESYFTSLPNRPKPITILSDGNYEYFKTDDIIQFLKADTTDQELYFGEGHDCDDFCVILLGNMKKWVTQTLRFQGSAMGIVYATLNGEHHAFNWYLDENKKIKAIEPQSDQFIDWHSNVDSAYFLFA